MTSEKKSRSKTADRRKEARVEVEPAEPSADDVAAAVWQDRAAWHERASFRVALYSITDAAGDVHWQTRAYHDESDGNATWPEVAGEKLLRWMCEEAGLLAPAEATEAPEQPPSDQSTPAEVAEPPELSASDHVTPDMSTAPSAAGQDDNLRIALGEIQLDEIAAEQAVGGQAIARHLRAKIDMRLSGTEASVATAAQAACAAQLVAYNLETGAALVLAAQQQRLQPELLDYTIEATCEIPDVGRYQVVGTATIAEHGAAEVAIGPVLTVEP